jgi:hypothetical protein
VKGTAKLNSPVVNRLDSLIGRRGLISVVSHLFAVPETKLLTCGYTIANLSANMGTPVVVVGEQYCVPSTCQYTLSKAQKRSKNWSVVDAANGAVIFTLVRFNTNPNGWFSKYETQLVDAQGNIVARIQDKKHGRWKVLGGSPDSNVLCSVKMCGLLLHWKTALKVFLASNLSEQQPDYTVQLKKISARDYTILHGTQPMSKVCE